MANLRAIFFDVGDTLVFDSPSMSQRIATSFRSIGLDIPEAQIQAGLRCAEDYIVPLYATGIDTDMPEFKRHATDLICRVASVPELDDPSWAAFAHAFESSPYTRIAHPAAGELLESLSNLSDKRLHLGIISDWDAGLPAILDELGLLKYFSSLSISALVGAQKPSTTLFEHALSQSGSSPDESVHIGDFYELDYIGAGGVGMKTILFDWRNRSPLPGVNRVTTFSELARTLTSLVGLR